jgi:protocatechuate 3,4-dioxygenase alpha subunit
VSGRRIPTAFHTVGPFFPAAFVGPADHDLRRRRPEAAPSARGQAMVLHGRVAESGGAPVVNVMLECRQADAAGRYAHPADPQAAEADPDFLGWGRACTDAEGRYRFVTLRPGGHAEGNAWRAPHFDLTLFGLGIMIPLATTVFLPGEAANKADPVWLAVPAKRRALLVAAEDGTQDGLPAFRFDILLRGEEAAETPFFAIAEDAATFRY